MTTAVAMIAAFFRDVVGTLTASIAGALNAGALDRSLGLNTFGSVPAPPVDFSELVSLDNVLISISGAGGESGAFPVVGFCGESGGGGGGGGRGGVRVGWAALRGSGGWRR